MTYLVIGYSVLVGCTIGMLIHSLVEARYAWAAWWFLLALVYSGAAIHYL
jgi:hypothetical protein